MAGRIASRGSDQFMVRFPEGMRDKIKALADENIRSMNAEIISRLETSITEEGTPHGTVSLRLPLEVISDAKGLALTYNQSLEEFVATTIKRELNLSDQIDSVSDFVENLEDEIAELREENERLTTELESSSNNIRNLQQLLLEQKANKDGFASLMKSTMHHLLSYGDAMPSEIRDMAKEILGILSVTIADVLDEVKHDND